MARLSLTLPALLLIACSSRAPSAVGGTCQAESDCEARLVCDPPLVGGFGGGECRIPCVVNQPDAGCPGGCFCPLTFVGRQVCVPVTTDGGAPVDAGC